MALAPLARRGFLGRLAALPILGAGGASIFARRADAAADAIMRQIDEAERRCILALQAFDEALVACEAALPPLHWTLDITHQRPRRFRAEIERGFDGSTPKRYINVNGLPDHRYVATVYTLTQDLEDCPFGPRGKTIRRMMRRARKRQATVERVEETFRLFDLNAELLRAQKALQELAKAIFAKPATTLPEVRIQARMLCAYASGTPEQYGRYQAGLYGTMLAENLDRLAA